jgi:hypothetical protein
MEKEIGRERLKIALRGAVQVMNARMVDTFSGEQLPRICKKFAEKRACRVAIQICMILPDVSRYIWLAQ